MGDAEKGVSEDSRLQVEEPTFQPTPSLFESNPYCTLPFPNAQSWSRPVLHEAIRRCALSPRLSLRASLLTYICDNAVLLLASCISFRAGPGAAPIHSFDQPTSTAACRQGPRENVRLQQTPPSLLSFSSSDPRRKHILSSLCNSRRRLSAIVDLGHSLQGSRSLRATYPDPSNPRYRPNPRLLGW